MSLVWFPHTRRNGKKKLIADDYTIRYMTGKSNVLADFVSRKPSPGDLSSAEGVEDLRVLCIEEERIDAHTIVTAT